MNIIEKFIIALIAIGLTQSASVQAAQTGNAADPAFQKLQDDLRKDKYKKKVLSRFEVVEGQRGLALDDISLTLLDYSYHILNSSGKPEPFLTMRCNIDISRFEKEAEKLRKYLQSTGERGHINIALPDSERTIVGVIDNEKDELITFASVPKSVKLSVKFAELRRNKPEYMILVMDPENTSNGNEQLNAMGTSVMVFDEKSKVYSSVLDLKTYRRVDPHDDLENRSGYIDKSTVSWSDWINGEYRELIVSTDRKNLDGKAGARQAFRNKKDIYVRINAKELTLVEQIVDGKSTMSKRGAQVSPPREIKLKDGELYELNGKAAGAMITATGGKINSYIQSPDKRHVAYSVIVGYTADAGNYEKDEKVPQVPVYHIIVMDLGLKKQLTEIKPPSNSEPFIYAKRWTSNEELALYEADGIAVGRYYFYNVISNELRNGDLSDLEEMSR